MSAQLKLFSDRLRAVDLFAGAGGFTTAATQAGFEVVWAANHWRAAVEIHANNHPDARHVCQDLHQADWREVPVHDVLLASPACQAHSNAATRGGKNRRRGTAPSHDRLRSTAWAVVACAEVHRPRFVVVENVREFRNWVLFDAWRGALQALGYSLTETVIDSADLGVPQNRHRLFVVGTLDGALEIPEPSRAWRGAASFLDLDAGRWEPVSDKTPAVRKRVRNGIKRELGPVFVTQHVTNHPGRSIERPLGTVTTKSHWGVVRRRRRRWEMRMLTIDETRAAMGFPRSYRLPKHKGAAIKMLGNAVVPAVGRYVLDAIKAAA